MNKKLKKNKNKNIFLVLKFYFTSFFFISMIRSESIRVFTLTQSANRKGLSPKVIIEGNVQARRQIKCEQSTVTKLNVHHQ